MKSINIDWIKISTIIMAILITVLATAIIYLTQIVHLSGIRIMIQSRHHHLKVKNGLTQRLSQRMLLKMIVMLTALVPLHVPEL